MPDSRRALSPRPLILTPGSILDANGNWTAEEGTYRKMDLCRAHDLDVSHRPRRC